MVWAEDFGGVIVEDEKVVHLVWVVVEVVVVVVVVVDPGMVEELVGWEESKGCGCLNQCLEVVICMPEGVWMVEDK